LISLAAATACAICVGVATFEGAAVVACERVAADATLAPMMTPSKANPTPDPRTAAFTARFTSFR
jgi:hypothetical protein